MTKSIEERVGILENENQTQGQDITNMTEQQIGAINIVLATGIVLAIRDTIVRK